MLPPQNATTVRIFVKTLNKDKCYFENALWGNEGTRAGSAVHLAMQAHVRMCLDAFLEITKQRKNRAFFFFNLSFLAK